MSLLDVFKRNFADTSKSNNTLTYFEISSDEWKKIIKEFRTPIIEKELIVLLHGGGEVEMLQRNGDGAKCKWKKY